MQLWFHPVRHYIERGTIVDVRQACIAQSNSLELGFQWKGFTALMDFVADWSLVVALLYNYKMPHRLHVWDLK